MSRLLHLVQRGPPIRPRIVPFSLHQLHIIRSGIIIACVNERVKSSLTFFSSHSYETLLVHDCQRIRQCAKSPVSETCHQRTGCQLTGLSAKKTDYPVAFLVFGMDTIAISATLRSKAFRNLAKRWTYFGF